MEPTTLAYLAGLLDGEGCITASPNGSYYWLGVRISNTDLGLADWLQTTLGGTVNVWQPSGRRRRVFNWLLSGQRAADFLEQVSPYLIIKRRQAELWLAFWRLSPSQRREAETLRRAIREATRQAAACGLVTLPREACSGWRSA